MAALLMGASGCTTLAPREPTVTEAALPAPDRGALAARIEPMLRAHPGASGLVPLENGLDAFAARLWLADRAVSSLDVQCYIWRPDRTGRWLLARLLAAAERGVRVRLLLDDHNGSGALDGLLASINGHERLEVRLFNPYRQRSGVGRAIGLASDFSRLNRRMHNKSFTADRRASILGGRNVGDEYFGIADAMQFADLDVLAVGPVVADVSDAFDLYWNSASAYPLASVVGGTPLAPATPAELLTAGNAETYARQLSEQPQVERWRDSGPVDGDFAWGRAQLFVDPPGKVLERAPKTELMMPRLQRQLGRAQRSIDIVSPYFVPEEEGIETFAALVREGVRVRVLTNSLAATDVAAVHAGYADRRPALLDAGVELYELKPTPPRSQRRSRLLGFGRSREASLHAKTFAVDGERVYIGSLNFDPRSAWLNTEIGVLLEHGGLARRVGAAFDTDVPRQAWRLSKDEDGAGLRWTELGADGPVSHGHDPQTSLPLRWWTRMLSLLPIDWLL